MSLFLKSQNKWWDGYDGQAVALLDDYDGDWKAFGHLLKIWADQYVFPGEVKHGTL